MILFILFFGGKLYHKTFLVGQIVALQVAFSKKSLKLIQKC